MGVGAGTLVPLPESPWQKHEGRTRLRGPYPLNVGGSMTFVAFDVETANPDYSSICQIGAAQFSNGRLGETWKTLIASIREQHRRLPAFQEELTNAGL